ncbi:sensor histidine kinase [Streptomyces yaizuensis]|uniref:histidine kinase n=1 Tax=Streptomyces yaizuensis TaxID=2989713 RepID=A0ABQ5P6C5_9ACTN|nr:ATP-binding protein [Streptomyces sp. YSPA8]GLF98130.1 ATP-binding protein [Streptomyces sp. YSPA8]
MAEPRTPRARHRRRADLARPAVVAPAVVSLAGTIGAAGLSLTAPHVLPPAAAWTLVTGFGGAALLVSWRRAARISPPPSSPSPVPAPPPEHEQDVVGRLLALAEQGRWDVSHLAGRIQRGEQPAVPRPRPLPAGDGPLAQLERLLVRGQDEALAVIASVAQDRRTAAAVPGQQVDILVHIARRLEVLVLRALEQLDLIERSVEDPDELAQLFALDNLVTLLRRSIENLAVLGGGSPRQIRNPVEIQEVLRTAMGETAQYARMKVTSCPPGTIPGFAMVEIANMLAELLENASDYSHPSTPVEIRAQRAEDGGLAIEIDDRALAMAEGQLERMNDLMAHPENADLTGQLREGRTGLIVVAMIARRHGATVHLASRTDGPGHRATVTLPPRLVTTPPPDAAPHEAERVPVPAASAPAPVPHATAPKRPGPRPSPPGPALLPARTPGRRALPVRTAAPPEPVAPEPAREPVSGRGLADSVAAAEVLRGAALSVPPTQGESR